MSSSPLQTGVVYQQTPTTGNNASPGEWHIDGYYFDAWLRLNHNTSVSYTQHPLEVGAAASDHSYVNMRTFSFDICVTDTVRQPFFTGVSNRNINAYNLLVALQAKRSLITLGSKYGEFSNVLVESIDVSDDFQSQNKMIATINLVQLIIAGTKIFKVSANPQATDTTNRGNISPIPPLGTEEFRYYILKKTQRDFGILVK